MLSLFSGLFRAKPQPRITEWSNAEFSATYCDDSQKWHITDKIRGHITTADSLDAIASRLH